MYQLKHTHSLVVNTTRDDGATGRRLCPGWRIVKNRLCGAAMMVNGGVALVDVFLGVLCES